MLMPMRPGSWLRARSATADHCFSSSRPVIGDLVEVLGVGNGEVVAADAASLAGEDEAREDGSQVVEAGSSSGRADRGNPPGRG